VDGTPPTRWPAYVNSFRDSHLQSIGEGAVAGTGRALMRVLAGPAGTFLTEKWMRLVLSLALVGTVLVSAPLAAQGRARQSESVPEGHKPPPGMCRIWLPNVPAGKQAAPTDCATAVRNRPANATVIFGDPVPGRATKPREDMPVPLPLAPTSKGKGKKRPPISLPPGTSDR